MNELFSGDVKNLEMLIERLKLFVDGTTDVFRIFGATRGEVLSMILSAERVLAWLWSDEEEGSYAENNQE